MFLDFIMMNEDYTPRSKPSFHGWGSDDTNTAETQMQLQEECLKTLAKKFKANREEINTDVDAISVLITAEDLCVTKKKEVRIFSSCLELDGLFDAIFLIVCLGLYAKMGYFHVTRITKNVNTSQATCMERKC